MYCLHDPALPVRYYSTLCMLEHCTDFVQYFSVVQVRWPAHTILFTAFSLHTIFCTLPSESFLQPPQAPTGVIDLARQVHHILSATPSMS